MKKILLTGSSGQLGKSIQKVNDIEKEYEIVATDIDTLDITNQEKIDEMFSTEKPDIVINAAAYTNVDKAEEEEELATRINGVAPGLLAKACKDHGALFIHISTDYVFNGQKETAYSEIDSVEPINAYGRSKLAGEQSVARSGSPALIIRTSWLYSEFGHNFIKTMLRLARENKALKVINDQYGCPTYAGDLAEAILFLAGNNFTRGVTIFHITNNNYTSWYSLACRAFDYEGIEADITPVATEEYDSATVRPMRSILDNSRLETITGYHMPSWEDGLQKCIDALNQQ